MADEKELELAGSGSIEAVSGFLQAEKEYVENLRIGFETFYNRLDVHCKLNKVIISEEEIQILFGNYGTLFNANSNLLSSLNDLRLEGKTDLRDGLGKVMLDFIPYFKLYIDYIVKKQIANEKLGELKRGNKKFREFLKINEMCAKKKLKAVLEQPVLQLPLYLIHLNRIHEAMTNENLVGDRVEKVKKAIYDIEKVTEEIATKSKDQKARRLVGQLQEKIFKNKVALIASHRFVIHHQVLGMLVKKSIVHNHFILCNDILVISTEPSRISAGKLIAVFPLIGVRVLHNPSVNELVEANDNNNENSNENELSHRIAIIPQNKNFTPSESTTIGSVIIFFDNEDDRLYWIDTIEEAVDEEEHNLRPCNPVDLEKRLKKEKCSNEGLQDTIQITDEKKIEEIEAWKKQKDENPNKSKKRRAKPKPKTKTKQSSKSDTKSGSKLKMSLKAGFKSNSKQSSPGPSDPGPSDPAPSVTSSSASAAVASSSHGPSPPGPSPHGPSPPQRRSAVGPPPGAGAGAGAAAAGGKPPPRRTTVGGSSNKPPPPRGAGGPSGPGPAPSRAPPKRGALPNAPPSGPPTRAPPSNVSNTSNGNAPPAKRANLLAGIANFKKDGLKKSSDRERGFSENERGSSMSQQPQTMDQKLANTLEKYREFVMDDDDDASDRSDDDWE